MSEVLHVHRHTGSQNYHLPSVSRLDLLEITGKFHSPHCRHVKIKSPFKHIYLNIKYGNDNNLLLCGLFQRVSIICLAGNE